MAEVQVKEQEGGKNKQKKQHLRVDFTPMVDMNMLLITFFMFCTTLLSPQTMQIAMPAKDKVDDDQANKVRESTAVTLLLGANDEVFYYLGLIEDVYENLDLLVPSSYDTDGIRKLLLEKNKGTYELIQDLKLKLKNLDISEEEYYAESGKIQEVALKETKIAPSVIIKPTDKATYKNMVDTLDEMLVTNIGSYAVIELSDGDRYLLYQKTSNPEYLTEEQLKQLD